MCVVSGGSTTADIGLYTSQAQNLIQLPSSERSDSQIMELFNQGLLICDKFVKIKQYNIELILRVAHNSLIDANQLNLNTNEEFCTPT